MAFILSERTAPENGGGNGGGGGGGGGQATPGCDLVRQLPDVKKGDPPESMTFTFTNSLETPLTFTGVTVESATPERWKVDAPQLTGTLLPGEQRSFVVTYTPPAK